MTRLGKSVQTPEAAWLAGKASERETVTHPCDVWDASRCMCKGECSCHWRDDIRDLDALHRSFYDTFDPEPDMVWVVPFLDPDALGGGEE